MLSHDNKSDSEKGDDEEEGKVERNEEKNEEEEDEHLQYEYDTEQEGKNLQMKMITNLCHRFKRALVIPNKVLKRQPQATRRTGTKHQVRRKPQMTMMMKMTFLQMVAVTKMRRRRRLKV